MLSDPNSQGEIGLNVLADNEAFCTETRQWCAEVQSGETGGISLHPLGTHLDPSPVHNLSLVSFHFHLHLKPYIYTIFVHPTQKRSQFIIRESSCSLPLPPIQFPQTANGITHNRENPSHHTIRLSGLSSFSLHFVEGLFTSIFYANLENLEACEVSLNSLEI